jgi:predicted PurR-regulated permease PerM
MTDAPAPARLVKILILIAIVLGAGAVLWMVASVFDRVHNTCVVIIFSILFTYLVYPPVAWLERRRVPVAVAAIIVYIVVGAVVAGALAWLAPAIATQVTQLAHEFPHIVASAQREMADPAHSPLLARLPDGVRDQIAANAGKAGALVGGFATGFGTHALGALSGTTTAVIDVFLVLGLTLLVLGDLTLLRAFGLRVVPARYRAGTIGFMRDVDGVIGGFVRGQVLLAVAVGIAGTIVLLAVGVPYAILLGTLAGVVSIIPLVGPIAAALPVLVIAFFTVGLVKLIVVGVLYVVILVVQQNVLTPLVVSKSVGVTPLVVFLALLFGSEAFGILGALLAIPIAGIIRVATERIFPEEQRTMEFRSTKGPSTRNAIEGES